MTLFGYLFDSNWKAQRDHDKKRGEASDEVAHDPFDEAQTVRRLRADMNRVVVLNRALISLLIKNEVIGLDELTQISKEINQEDDAATADQMEMCKDCGRHSFRAKANCIYCDALQL